MGAAARNVPLQIPAEIEPADAIDAACQAKYGNTSAIATTPQARSANIRIIPAPSPDQPDCP